MRKTIIRAWGAAVAAACLLAVAPGWAEQKIKITVAGKDAAIHLSPDAGSRIIQSAPFGSVFEAERKTGEWYEIKLPSKLGVTITGYIHEKFVATEQAPAKTPEAPAQIAREPVVPAAGEEAVGQGRYRRPLRLFPRIERLQPERVHLHLEQRKPQDGRGSGGDRTRVRDLPRSGARLQLFSEPAASAFS